MEIKLKEARIHGINGTTDTVFSVVIFDKIRLAIIQ
jgi:hypothetical protein